VPSIGLAGLHVISRERTALTTRAHLRSRGRVLPAGHPAGSRYPLCGGLIAT